MFHNSQISWQESSDLLLLPNEVNGIKKLSLIRTSKIATIDKDLVKGLLGKLSEDEIHNLNTNLKIIFQI
jgi:mRNA interferase MazF